MPPRNPCIPSPCGHFSTCRVVKDHPVCSCLNDYYGAPPNCHPECIISADCTSNKACLKNKCVDPCPGTCGYNALCRVVNHNPICSCLPGFIGDPFVQCYQQPSKHSKCKFNKNILSININLYILTCRRSNYNS